MSIELSKTPKTIQRKDSSAIVTWKNTLPNLKSNEIYILQIYNDLNGWKTIYWGKKPQCEVKNLSPCSYYNLRIKIQSKHSSSDWIKFKTGTDVDQYYVRHFTRAITYSKIPVIRKIILRRPEFLETENKENRTPLMQATENNNLSIINFLVNSGAKVDAPSRFEKRTSLMMAVIKGLIPAATYLINKGAKINNQDINGMSALHFAVDSNCLETVKFVLNKGGDVNEKDNQGWNSLMRAIILEASDDIIKLLVESGADFKSKDKRGYSVRDRLQLFKRNNLEILLKYE